MDDASTPQIDRPPRSLAAPSLAWQCYLLDLRRRAPAKGFLLLFGALCLPVIVAAIQGLMGDLAPDYFTSLFHSAYLPFLIPLATLFLGGPTIIDEVEGQTLTYLTLRPIPRGLLYIAKLASSLTLALIVVLVPVGLLSLVGLISGVPVDASTLMQAMASSALGALTYTALFACLGVLFSATLLPGIVYFVVFEIILFTIPLVELLSVKFHLYTVAGLDPTGSADEDSTGLRQLMEQLILDAPLSIAPWQSAVALLVVVPAAILAGALLFDSRQFHH